MAERIKGGTKRQDSNAGASEPRKHTPSHRTCSRDSGSLRQHLRAGWEGRRKAMGTAGSGRKAPETGRSWISAAPYKMHQKWGPGSSALLAAGASCPGTAGLLPIQAPSHLSCQALPHQGCPCTGARWVGHMQWATRPRQVQPQALRGSSVPAPQGLRTHTRVSRLANLTAGRKGSARGGVDPEGHTHTPAQGALPSFHP